MNDKREPVGDGVDPAWFRPPSRRERRIAAGLFLGFGLFFVVLFFVNRGWWFRWVILALGVFSIVHGIRHVRASRAVAAADSDWQNGAER